MWDLIVSVPDHCLSFYFDSFQFWIIQNDTVYIFSSIWNSTANSVNLMYIRLSTCIMYHVRRKNIVL